MPLSPNPFHEPPLPVPSPPSFVRGRGSHAFVCGSGVQCANSLGEFSPLTLSPFACRAVASLPRRSVLAKAGARRRVPHGAREKSTFCFTKSMAPSPRALRDLLLPLANHEAPRLCFTFVPGCLGGVKSTL